MGSVAFVLHSHLPWLRRNGTFPAGEEWLFQAWSESYLPLLDVLERLAVDGVRDALTIGITPVLAEQMDDPHLLGEFHGWLGRRLLDLEHTVARYAGPDADDLREVWSDHWRRQTALLERVESGLLATGLTAPFRALADAGVVEILGGPATHPYLPLFDDPGLVAGQIEAGMAVTESWLGRRPAGVWTPECAYRPAGRVGDPTRGGAPSGVELPGLEDFWQHAGVDRLVLDGPTLAVAAGAPARDWAWTAGELPRPGDPLDVLDRPVLVGDSDVAAYGRNLAVSYAVWNPHGGYPADPRYRDFYRIDLEGGFKSWRVTGRDRWDKLPYDKGAARGAAMAHAEDFVSLVGHYLAPRPDDATVVAAYDTELFGHWWHEGPLWLEAVLRGLRREPRLATTTLGHDRERRNRLPRLALSESSWGRGKRHDSWVSPQTYWVWEAIREAEAAFAGLQPGPARDAAWRQLLLLQASDWPFLITQDTASGYAAERVRGHVDRFRRAVRGHDLGALADIDGRAAAPAPAGADLTP